MVGRFRFHLYWLTVNGHQVEGLREIDSSRATPAALLHDCRHRHCRSEGDTEDRQSRQDRLVGSRGLRERYAVAALEPYSDSRPGHTPDMAQQCLPLLLMM